MNAPPMHRMRSSGTLLSHCSWMVSRINSSATMARPNMAGKESMAVRRIILRNTRRSRSLSPVTCAITGCATCAIVPLRNE